MKVILVILSLLICSGTLVSQKPTISFFNELKSNEFNKLFADTALINHLVAMKAEVRVGLLDMDAERASTIRKLNEAGIPLVAWLLLPEEDGYWFNSGNSGKAARRYEEFTRWSSENNLKWKGIGIDLEPDMNDAKLMMTHPWKLALRLYLRLYDRKKVKEAAESYKTLISRMQSDGYRVESYTIPMIYVDRRRGSTSFQRLAGMVDIKTDIEIPMLYTSAMGNPAVIPAWHIENMPVALGSTGGGVKIEGFELASLTWEELERDILIASGITGEIHIFCLESSWEKGFLQRMNEIDFSKTVTVTDADREKVKKMTSLIGFILFVLNYPFLLTIVILSLIAFFVWGCYRSVIFLIKRLSGKY